jgi:hypothetical protein
MPNESAFAILRINYNYMVSTKFTCLALKTLLDEFRVRFTSLLNGQVVDSNFGYMISSTKAPTYVGTVTISVY